MTIGLVPDLLHDKSEMAKSMVALGGIRGGLPFSPYASSGGTVISRKPPTFMPSMPTITPRIMLPGPDIAP